MSSQNNTPVVVRDEGRVRVVVLNRPERLNALDMDMQRALAGALKAAEAEEGVGAVVLAGEGGNFSAGADLGLMQRLVRGGREMMEFTDLGFVRLFMELSKPLVAAVEGVAVGWGATVGLWCDIRVAGEGARFRFPFALLGLTPEFGSSFWLGRIVGFGRAMELMLTGRWVNAAEAKEIGLVNEVVAEGRALKRAVELAGELARLPSRALAATRVLIRLGATASHPEQVLEPEISRFRQALRGAEFARSLSKILGKNPGDGS